MHEHKRWIAILAALAVGFGGGQVFSQMRASRPISTDSSVCLDALERIDSLDRRMAATARLQADRLALQASASHVFPAKASATPASAISDPETESSITRELRNLGSQLEELRSASLCRSPQALARAEDEAKLESPRNARALEQARRLVEDARYRGRWTDRDAADLRETLPLLTRQQQDEILGVLVPALQTELEVDSFPPF